METPFTRIISGAVPSFRIAEDELHLAILEKKPVKKGHIVVLPKKPVNFIYDMADGDLCALQLFAKKVSHALRQAVPCKKIGIAVIGLEVPHAHIHLVPLDAVAELNFAGARLEFSDSEFDALATIIRSYI